MKGYWKNDSLTADTVDSDRWLHTGDLAEIKEHRVFLRGRMTKLISLSTGEKVSPGEIEACILHDTLFKHAFVVGNDKPFLSAVIELDKDAWHGLAAKLQVPLTEPNHSAIKKEVLRRLDVQLEHLARRTQIRAVYLTLDPWTRANGLLTPTLKIKRARLEAKYASEIGKLYFDRTISS